VRQRVVRKRPLAKKERGKGKAQAKARRVRERKERLLKKVRR
jgi:hypothetical protein